MAKKTAKKKVAKKKVAKKKPQILQRIAKLKGDLEAAKSKATRQGQTLFKEAVKEIFKEFKGLERFGWNQYTMHWNDGDPCIFETYFDSSLAIDGEIDNDEVEDVGSLEHSYELLKKKEKEEARIIFELSNKSNKQGWEVEQLKSDLEILRNKDFETIAKKYEVKKTIKDLLEGIDNSIYEEMFGEGTVVVSREGIVIHDCEHD
jgi:hypothetical protein